MEIFPNIMCSPVIGKIVSADGMKIRRQEMLAALSQYMYGKTPPAPESFRADIISSDGKNCSGNALPERIRLSFDTPAGSFDFEFSLLSNLKKRKNPVFVLMNFRDGLYDMYIPTEEIIDNGFSLAVIHYNDISRDNTDMSDGLAGHFDTSAPDAPGKIGIWAYAISRVIDYLVTRDDIDKENIAVIGHSRLGKTALWCGAQDERVKFTISNCSGCGGAAMEQIKHDKAETVDIMMKNFPAWLCKNRKAAAAANGNASPLFDQHFLLACIAPRYLLVGSAEDDLWADPLSEKISCYEASVAWEAYGLRPFEKISSPEDIIGAFQCDRIHYHKRKGIHYLGRGDWLYYIDFIKRNL